MSLKFSDHSIGRKVVLRRRDLSKIFLSLTMESQTIRLQSEWKKRIASSPEVKRAGSNLEFHRRKIRKMHEELSVAEQWEKELEKRLEIAEQNVKPSILKFAEEFEKSNLVEESVVEATLDEDELERLISMMRKKAVAMLEMDGSQLLGLIKTILVVRDGLLGKGNQDGVDIMQQMAGDVMKQLGKIDIDWLQMSPWEANLVRLLVKQVEGVPAFVSKMMDQFLSNIININNNATPNISSSQS